MLQDLAATLSVTDREAPWQTILFGAAAAERHQEHGFLPADGRFAWAQRRPDVIFKLTTVEPRIALLDASLPVGLQEQSATVSLNGTRIGTIEVRGRRRRYRIDLPEAQQRVGANRLSFVFRQVTMPADPDAPRLAAGFHSLTVGAATSAPLLELLAPEAPPPLSSEALDGVPAIVQAGPSILHYAMEARPGAELRFTPGINGSARNLGSRVRLSVRVESEGAPAREVWSAEASGSAREVAVKLPSTGAGPLRVSLSVEGPDHAWAVWRAPRVVKADGAAPTPEPSPAPKPTLPANLNVVMIVLDAGGAKHFGAYGYERATTPEIDRLAKEGILFEQVFTPAVFTLSAMASVWTSEYHEQHHAGVAYDAALPLESPTLAELLSEKGIHTTSIVANGMAGRGLGLDRGFLDYQRVPPPYDADTLTAMALPVLEANRTRRFFTYLHFREPHFPYDPGPPYTTMFGPDAPLGRGPRTEVNWTNAVNSRAQSATAEERAHLTRLYDGNLARADHAIGELRRALEAKGLWENTAVIVTADHGEAMSEHGFIGHNEQLYDESTHVPLVIRLPGGPSGRRVPGLADLVDLAPTIAELFGVRGQEKQRGFQGRSLLDRLGGGPAREFVVTRTVGPQPQYAWRDQKFKLMLNVRYGNQEMYDLSQDPGEERDIQEARPLLASLYRQRLLAWIEAHRSNRVARGKAAPLSKEELDNLKALGYVR